MRPARRALAATVPAAVALTAPAAASAADVPDGKEGNGAVVVVTAPGAEPEVVAPSTGTVTSGTVETPAAGEAAPLASQPQGQSETTTATPDQGTTTTQVESDSGRVVVTDATTTATADSTPTTAVTVNTVEAPSTVVTLKRSVKLTVKDGRSRTVARRNRRRQVTKGEATIGAGDRAAGAQGRSAVTLGDVVTVDRVRVRSRSVSEPGRAPRTRLTLDVRNVRLRARSGGPALLTVRYARLTRGRRVRIRILLTPRDGRPVARTLIVRQGSDVLDGRLYRQSPAMRDAFRRVRSQLRVVTGEDGLLPRLRVRIGRNRVHPGTDEDGRQQTFGRLDGVTIRFRVPRTGDGAGASQLGLISATLGRVNSAATQIADAAVTVATEAGSAVADVVPKVPGAAASVRDFVFRPPELELDERDLRLERRAIVIRLECSADARGVLHLRPARPDQGLPREIGSDAFACAGGVAEVRIRVGPALARLLRERAPLLLAVTLEDAEPSGTDLDLPERLRLVAP